MAIDPTLLPSLRTQALVDGAPLHEAAFLYQQADGSVWLDQGILGSVPKMIQPPPLSAPPSAV